MILPDGIDRVRALTRPTVGRGGGLPLARGTGQSPVGHVPRCRRRFRSHRAPNDVVERNKQTSDGCHTGKAVFVVPAESRDSSDGEETKREIPGTGPRTGYCSRVIVAVPENRIRGTQEGEHVRRDDVAGIAVPVRLGQVPRIRPSVRWADRERIGVRYHILYMPVARPPSNRGTVSRPYTYVCNNITYNEWPRHVRYVSPFPTARNDYDDGNTPKYIV